MNGVALLVVLFVIFGLFLAAFAFVAYRRVLRRAKGIERGLKMVPLLIHLPPPGDSDPNTMRDVRDLMREKVSQAQVLYDLISGTAQPGFKSSFYGQRHIAFELIASNGLIHFFAAVPVTMVPVVEQAILTAYPGARLEEVEDHNIFNPQGKLTGTAGGELVLRHEAAYPIGTLERMEKDPIEGLLNALSKLQLGDGAAVQIMLRPAKQNWAKRSAALVNKKRRTRQGTLSFTATDMAKAAVKSPDQWHEESQQYQPSKLEESVLQAIEEKTKHPGYETLIRVITSSPSYDRSHMLLRNIITAFALYESPGSNGFQFLEARDIQGLVTAFIFRFFPPEVASNILNSVELATLFHLPDAQFTATSQVERQQSKQVDGPVNMPASGLLLGYNFYRGIKKEIRLSSEDRRRHMYMVGQTGTGKTTALENLMVQDMLAGNGFAFIDPHGDAAEKLISMVPKERAEDVIYFNPADTEHPLGLNLFEFSSPEQKDFLIQETINMLYKLYDPQHTGIIGPRFEHWFRNAALTLMADPGGASFIEIPKVFTDTDYLKNKFKHLNDPTVIDFWTKEMGQTSDYHKSEMLGWFVSKFGAFQSNEMMRNIIGQTQSSFDLRDIMDKKKILIVNLSKGLTGELNSKLLGMMFVIKIQAAAMSRSNIPEEQRNDFCLYVDEFQNFSTDSFASILSEARKYRLNLIVANQFIGQLSDEIREAVFGNIGTMMSYRSGPEDAELLVKQFEPIFDVRDLINLPNYNAVMKLLIGGLPSQPFSLTALPPLGQAHAEMGLAIKQLSAAKFGTTRAMVEADIFARLQNQPRPAAAPAATSPSVPAVPPAAEPPVAGAEASAPPAAPPTPAPKPAASEGLSLADLKPAAPTSAPTPASAPAIAPVNQSSISGVVGVVSPAPPPAAPEPKPEPPGDTKPVALIEAHETDGHATDSNPVPAAPAAATAPPPEPKETPSVPSSAQQAPAPPATVADTPKHPLLIEAHETEGRVVQPSEQQLSQAAQHDIDVALNAMGASADPAPSKSVEPTPPSETEPEPPEPESVPKEPEPKPEPEPQLEPEPQPEATPADADTEASEDAEEVEIPSDQMVSRSSQEHHERHLGQSTSSTSEASSSTTSADSPQGVSSDPVAPNPSETAEEPAPQPNSEEPAPVVPPSPAPEAPQDSAPLPTPEPVPVAAGSAPADDQSPHPKLQPGEIFVDENGNVVQG
jgi:hypothetical protein